MEYLVVLIALTPIWSEILFDHLRWYKGLDDKPLSTYLRVALFVILAFVITPLHPTHDVWYIFNLLTAGLFLFGTHLLLFDFSLNLTRKGKGFFYHKEGEIWYGVPHVGELFIKAVVAWVFWIGFFHWDWICCMGFPTRLIEYFQF